MAKATRKDALSLKLVEDQLPAPFVDYRANLEWRDGLPFLVGVPERISSQPEDALRALMRKTLDLPYDGPDPTLVGLSQGEAMIINMTRQAASGDPVARASILDRILGRPQQNIKSINLSGDINDFLDTVARDMKIETIDVPPAPTVDNSVEDL